LAQITEHVNPGRSMWRRRGVWWILALPWLALGSLVSPGLAQPPPDGTDPVASAAWRSKTILSAWSTLASGNAVAAEAEFRSLIAFDATDHEAHRGLGEALRAQGRFFEARKEFIRALSLGSDSPDTRRALGELYSYAAKNQGHGITLLRGMLREEPGDLETRLSLARAHKWAGEHDEAIAQYDTLLASPAVAAESPVDPKTVRLERAEVLSWSRRFGEAQAEYRAVLAGDPRNPAALTGLGEIASWRGRSLRGHRYFERALAEHPDDRLASRIHLGEARYRTETQELGRARHHIQSARALDGSNTEATSWLYHLNWVDAPEVQPGGYYLEDSNEFSRLVVQVPARFNDRSFSFTTGVVAARYESETKSIHRTTLPVQVGLALSGRTIVAAGGAFHVYGALGGVEGDVDDTGTGFGSVRFVLTETTGFEAHVAVRDFIDRADPFEVVFYNNVSDIDVVLNEVRVTETTARFRQAIAPGLDVTVDGTYGDQTDDNWFRSANARIEWAPERVPGLVPRVHTHLLYYGRTDPTYFSPRDFESFSGGFRYGRDLTKSWSFRTEHDVLVQPDADEPLGRQHLIETTFRLPAASYLILNAFHLEAPDTQNPGEDNDRYTITQFGARLGVRFP